MATGIELATAYVSIVGSTSQLKKDINAAFAEADKSSAKAGKRIGENLSSGLGGTKNSAARAGKDAAAEYERALKSSLRGEKIGRMIGEPIGKGIGLAIKGGIGLAAVGATAAVGTLVASLTKGFTRLKNIDNAKFKLEALGNSAADVKKIMDNATKAVKGTAFGLDAAATTASTAVAAGVAPGSDLTAYLTNVADAATIAQTSMEEMGSIFNKVQTNGSAMTDDLQMLADRGLPIFTWLQKQYKVTGEDLRKMVEDGKVSSADFNRAISENLGGAAQKMGQSFEGAIQNLDAALGRVGATLLGIPFNEASGGIGSITTALDKLNAWMVANQDMMIDFWAGFGKGAISGAQDVLKTVSSMLLAFGQLQNAIGDILGGIMKAGATVDDFFGRDDKAREQYAQAEEFFAWGNSAATASDEINDLIASLDGNKASIDQWAERTKNAATLTKALGDAVATVDDNQILIKDNTPEVNKSLEDLGVKLETLPSGDVKLVPNTPEAQQIIDAFLGANNPTPPVPVPVVPQTDAADAAMQAFRDRWSKPLVVGVDILPGQTPAYPSGTITPDDLGGLLGSGGSSGVGGGGGGPGGPIGNMPKAYKGGGSYGLAAGSNSGGYGGGGVQFPGWVNQIAAEFGIKPSTYSGHQESDRNEPGYAPNPAGENRGIDWSGPVENMQRFADYLATVPGSVEQVIWQNPATGAAVEIAGGQPQPGYFAGDLGGHQNHVHTRQSAPIPIPRYDQGGFWPSGTLGINTTGKDEYVLTPEQLNELRGTPLAVPWGVDPIGGPDKTPSAGRFTPWWDMDWMPPENPEEVAPGNGKWWERGPAAGKGPFKFPPVGKVPGARPPLPSDQPNMAGDPRIKVWEQSLPRYDSGGWWPSGTAGMNTTGKDEYVLTPEEIEELKKQGVDPASVQHGMGQGAPPGPSPEKLAQLTGMPGAGPTPEQLNGQPQGGDGAELMGGSRTEGYIPAGAGSTAVAGESFMSGIYNMGAEVINGVIDQAASMASSAAGMAATAFAPGSGGAASGLTSAAIGMGTQAAKRGVEYGAQMLGIFTDSIIEQATPFGAPRILTTDATGFMPQQALMEAATTSLEKAFQPQQPQGPEQPEQVPAGGVTSQTAEMEPAAGGGPQFNTTVNATVKDVNELNRTLNDQQRLNIMQYSGRP